MRWKDSFAIGATTMFRPSSSAGDDETVTVIVRPAVPSSRR